MDIAIEQILLKNEKKKEYQRKHYEKNKETKIAASKQYYQEKIKPKLLEEQKLLQLVKQMNFNNEKIDEKLDENIVNKIDDKIDENIVDKIDDKIDETIKIPYKKQKISHVMKRLVWNTYIGEDIGKIKCMCCKLSDITQLTFDCGHIISESTGGELSIDNLIPICHSCNLSMGSHNLNEFMEINGLNQQNISVELLLNQKKKEQQSKYDAKRYPKIKEQKLAASKKQYYEKIKPEMEKLILLKEKKKEQRKISDAKKYLRIKEQRLEDNKKYYLEKTKPRITALNLKIEAYQHARWEKEQAIRDAHFEKIELDKLAHINKLKTEQPSIPSARDFFTK
jgi:5-methylcytosine-specific restriction endonuclease McrA